jgi:dethiobiotin synthetase
VSPAHGVFVTATDTGVGKTVLAAALCAARGARGDVVRAHKPVVTGVDAPEPGVPADDVLLAEVTGARPHEVAPERFGPAVSPHLAAQLAGRELDPAALLAAARAPLQAPGTVVVEGVGGLLVPLTPTWLVRDLAVALGLPVIVAARPGLGTISHTLLTVESARAAGLDVRAVVLGPWPAEPGPLERSNRETLAALTGCEVVVLPHVTELSAGPLAAAGATLPVDRWLGPPRAA